MTEARSFPFLSRCGCAARRSDQRPAASSFGAHTYGVGSRIPFNLLFRGETK